MSQLHLNGGTWVIAFRPLLVWIAISALLLVREYHVARAKGSTLTFTVEIEGHVSNRVPVTVTVGSTAVGDGRLPLGWRTITVAGEDTEPYSERRFLWYGVNDLGTVELEWSRGSLEMLVEPDPLEIEIQGPHKELTLSERPSDPISLPVGRYEIVVRFEHFSEVREVEVTRLGVSRVAVTPPVGNLTITSDPPDAVFELLSRARKRIARSGETPATLVNLPEGIYEVHVIRGKHRKEVSAIVGAGSTNRAHAAFSYGTFELTTDPPNATVTENGLEMGATPLSRKELLPGAYRYQVRAEGFLPLTLNVTLAADEVVSIATNLVSRAYGSAMDDARRLARLRSPDYERILDAANAALAERPGDPEAESIKAEALARLGAEQEARQAAARQAEEAAKRQFPAQAFSGATDSLTHADLFDTHRWDFNHPLGEVREALVRSLNARPIRWELVNETRVRADTILIHCTGKGFGSVGRRAVLLLSEVLPNEVACYAKFWDYALGEKVTLSIFQGIKPESLIPIHPRKYKPENPAIADGRRREIAEEFVAKLRHELR